MSEEWNPKSHWEDHPNWPHADWVLEVNQNYTRESYIQWVNNQILRSVK